MFRFLLNARLDGRIGPAFRLVIISPSCNMPDLTRICPVRATYLLPTISLTTRITPLVTRAGVADSGARVIGGICDFVHVCVCVCVCARARAVKGKWF